MANLLIYPNAAALSQSRTDLQDIEGSDDMLNRTDNNSIETESHLYEVLLEKTTRSFDRYEAPKRPPNVKISGELSFFLDDLLAFAEKELGQDKGNTLEEVIDLGIIGWYQNLDPVLRDRLGLPKTKPRQSDANVKKLRQSLETEEKRVEAAHSEANSQKAKFEAEITKLLQKQDEANRQIETLKQLLDEMETQQPTFAQPSKNSISGYPGGEDSGYTPLTIHGLKQSGNRSSKPKKKSRHHKRPTRRH